MFCLHPHAARLTAFPSCHVPRGFTLVELLLAIVVVAILAAIAVPTYNESVRKSRRSEAYTALAAVQQAQERWRNNNASYTTALTAAPGDDSPGLGLPDVTPGGYYAVSIDAADATGYTLTAFGRDGTSQASDECRGLRVRLAGGNLTYAGCGAADCGDFAATHTCWTR